MALGWISQSQATIEGPSNPTLLLPSHEPRPMTKRTITMCLVSLMGFGALFACGDAPPTNSPESNHHALEQRGPVLTEPSWVGVDTIDLREDAWGHVDRHFDDLRRDFTIFVTEPDGDVVQDALVALDLSSGERLEGATWYTGDATFRLLPGERPVQVTVASPGYVIQTNPIQPFLGGEGFSWTILQHNETPSDWARVTGKALATGSANQT